jgi:hypothetical protein
MNPNASSIWKKVSKRLDTMFFGSPDSDIADIYARSCIADTLKVGKRKCKYCGQYGIYHHAVCFYCGAPID